MTELQRATQLARSSVYSGVRRAEDWRGYHVYEPYTDPVWMKVGPPSVILAKGGEVRFSTYEETFERYHEMYPVDDDCAPEDIPDGFRD